MLPYPIKIKITQTAFPMQYKYGEHKPLSGHQTRDRCSENTSKQGKIAVSPQYMWQWFTLKDLGSFALAKPLLEVSPGHLDTKGFYFLASLVLSEMANQLFLYFSCHTLSSIKPIDYIKK